MIEVCRNPVKIYYQKHITRDGPSKIWILHPSVENEQETEAPVPCPASSAF